MLKDDGPFYINLNLRVGIPRSICKLAYIHMDFILFYKVIMNNILFIKLISIH